MNRTLIRLALVSPLLGAVSALAAVAPADTVGKYGFDWLNPAHAACRKIDGALSRRFTSCAPADTPSFTGKTGHLVCKVKGGEFLVFETKARCAEELETMQANGE